MRTIAIRLLNGQYLLSKIQHISTQHNIKAGVILSAVGGLQKSKIRVPVLDGEVKYITPLNTEIDSLHGTVSTNGCHLHITVSDLNGKVYGGHIKQGCLIRTTCEPVIGILDDTTFNREPDERTGFDELVVGTSA